MRVDLVNLGLVVNLVCLTFPVDSTINDSSANNVGAKLADNRLSV